MRTARSATALAVLLALLAACAGGSRQVDDALVARPAPRPTSTTAPSVAPVSPVGDAFVTAHNHWRRPVGSPAIAWSPMLAERSRHRAGVLRDAGCPLVHDDDEFGENLLLRWSRPRKPLLTADEVVAAWTESRTDYDYATNLCRPGGHCGHYTQVVWADTRAVGCGSARCQSDDGRHILIWVCKYDPPGNVLGQRPY